MFRRIELINNDIKHGLCGVSPEKVINAWFYKLRGPSKNIPNNARFYFTELGWQEVGRKVIEACQREKQDYRIIKIKENFVNVVWKDDFEVAAQPKARKY